MNLKKKKALAARTFGVGLERIEFVKPRLEEIKEAITKQDIRDLHKDGAIKIKPVKGRKILIKRKRKRSTGNIRKKVNKRKKEYATLTKKEADTKRRSKKGALRLPYLPHSAVAEPATSSSFSSFTCGIASQDGLLPLS